MSSSFHRRNLTAGQRPRWIASSAAPKQEWVPRGSISSSPQADTASVPSIVQEMQDKLTRGAIECVSCYDMVRRSTPIWSCSTCFSIFHLHCIRKWARSPACIASGNWHCPNCLTPQSTPARDLSYTCFCGRRRDPPNDQSLTPHSCGNPCGKPLHGEVDALRCPHVCVLQCHPGPCPPCKTFAPRRKCLCGKTNVARRCSDRRAPLSCGKPCNLFLACGRHTCERVCHNGACGSCRELLTANCFCGKKEEVVVCGDVAVNSDENSGLFSCNEVCGRSLLCGNHVCRENCHPGLCSDCELLPGKISTCHCGKKKVGRERKSCLDLIPTCSEVCGKPLVCEAHFCTKRCHEGDCPPCSAHVQQRCQCGSSRRTVECYQLFDKSISFICEKTCCRKKNCGRHRCNERCCVLSKSGDWDPHLCSLSCGKKLGCGNHTCQLLCHGGHCSPCLETIFTDLTCACGKSSIPPPIPCGTPIPSCPHLCSAPQPCGHPASHSCHFGDCPPCTFPVMKECVSGHVMLRNIPCCSKDIRCNLQCGKTRQCGIHACARTCHPAPCDSSPASESKSGVRSSCGQVCGAPRRDCNHNCAAPCHPLSSCLEQRCDFVATILCSCGRINATVPCGAGACSSSFSNDLESSVIPELSVSTQPINGDGMVPLEQRKMPCNDECYKAATKWQLADEFNVTLQNLDSALMWKQPRRVIAIEERFKFMAMVKSKEETGSSMKVHVFYHMLTEKRDAVLQMAEPLKLPVPTAGWEPKRFLVAHVTLKSMPGFGLNHGFLMVTAGPRRVLALLDMSRGAFISSLVLRFGRESRLVWLNDKNSMAVFSDPALQRLIHGFKFQDASMAPRIVGVAAPAAAESNICGVAVSAWIVALEGDSCELDWALKNARRWNLLDGDVVLESASDRVEDDSIDESVVDRGIADMSRGQEEDKWEESCE